MCELMSNTHTLCFILGWQGGTVHQVAKELGVEVQEILDADEAYMGTLCRIAQAVAPKRKGIDGVVLKHFRVCINALKADYDGHPIPSWLDNAEGILCIAEEG